MSVAERIYEEVQGLSEAAQQSVLDFVEFLAHKEREGLLQQESSPLPVALCAMEAEVWGEYTPRPFDEDA